jgi:uncharacterized protein (DUF1800 family)
MRLLILSIPAMSVAIVAACGGGGSSSRAATPTPSPTPTPTPVPTLVEMQAASKLASQSTFGLIYSDVETVAQMGHEAWLDEQIAITPTYHKPVVDDLMLMLDRGELPEVDDEFEHLIRFRRYAWWNRTMTAPDVFRQRIAFALSEIFVVSDNVDVLIISPYALSVYYDWLLANAFGNYRDLIEAVALNPAMGVYLSHVNNAKADPDRNTSPDENFAREVMQLFTIGLFELNPDGSQVLGANGQPIPTYDNDDIREMAKIFTGLSYGGPNASFGQPWPYFQARMQMFEDAHEPVEKRLLNGLVVPAEQPGDLDISDALDNLFNHPNVGPFIGKQLIQRLVSSNPSPDYVARVSSAFNGDQTGVRGDMAAVFKAILTDGEAQAPTNTIHAGRLREPLVRYIAMLRQLNATAEDGLFYSQGFTQQFLLRQHPLSAPSVFNFFLPAHSPTGPLADAQLVAPEFQITDSSSVVTMTNVIDWAVNGNLVLDIEPHFGAVSLDLGEYVALAQESNDALLDRLDVLFTHGGLSAATRTAIAAIMQDIDDVDFRTKRAIYLLLTSPDYATSI